MRPVTIRNIHIAGSERTAAQKLAALQRDTLRLHIRDYERAGQPVPDDVRERARQAGIEVKG